MKRAQKSLRWALIKDTKRDTGVNRLRGNNDDNKGKARTDENERLVKAVP